MYLRQLSLLLQPLFLPHPVRGVVVLDKYPGEEEEHGDQTGGGADVTAQVKLNMQMVLASFFNRHVVPILSIHCTALHS